MLTGNCPTQAKIRLEWATGLPANPTLGAQLYSLFPKLQFWNKMAPARTPVFS